MAINNSQNTQEWLLIYGQVQFVGNKLIFVHHYVNADVLSGYSVDWMPYYTNHMNTDAHHYANADVLASYSPDWRSYYTHHSSMDAHHYVSVDVLSG